MSVSLAMGSGGHVIVVLLIPEGNLAVTDLQVFLHDLFLVQIPALIRVLEAWLQGSTRLRSVRHGIADDPNSIRGKALAEKCFVLWFRSGRNGGSSLAVRFSFFLGRDR